MPNAAATLDTDYGPGAASRRPARAASRGKGRKRSLPIAGGLFSSVPRYGAIAITALIGIGIVVNALMMQHGHHPAPLFDVAAGKPAAVKAIVPKPEASKSVAAPTPAAELPLAAPVAVRAETAIRAPTRANKAVRGDDPIARLIGGSQPPHRGKTAADKHRRSED